MTSMNVSLPDEMRAFVDEQVSEGGFSTVSEYIRALVRDAQRRAAKDLLERQLLEGLDSGPAKEFTEKELQNIRLRGKARIDAEKRQ